MKMRLFEGVAQSMQKAVTRVFILAPIENRRYDLPMNFVTALAAVLSLQVLTVVLVKVVVVPTAPSRVR